jgi:hypothetical protein
MDMGKIQDSRRLQATKVSLESRSTFSTCHSYNTSNKIPVNTNTMKFLQLLLLAACSTTQAFSVVSQRLTSSVGVVVTSRESSRVVPAISNSKSYQHRRQPSCLFAADETSKEAEERLAKTIDPLVKDASKLLFRLSWLSWWGK